MCIVARGQVRCLSQASSSLKTPAIQPFYRIISGHPSTKLVYNLVYSQGPRTGVTVGGSLSASDLFLGDGAQGAGSSVRIADIG